MDRRTVEFYDAEAPAYAEYLTGSARTPWLRRFVERLPDGGSVLDLGCGSGWAAARFAEAGFAVTATDASAGLAEEARRRHDLEVRIAPFDRLADVAAFDGVWASFSLLHDSRTAMPGHIGRVARALRPGGHLYLGLKEGAGARRDSLGRLYTYFGKAEMAGLLEVAAFDVLVCEVEPGTGYDGTAERMLHLIARRSG